MTDPVHSESPATPSTGVSLPAAAALVAGNMIGIGIFTTLGYQVADIQSGFSIVLLWLLGGVIAFCGALSYGELGAALPRSGGEYHLLGRVWHPLAGFLSGWLSMTVGFAAPVALAASAFGTYLANSVLGGGEVARFGAGLAILAVTTLVHLFTLRLSSRFQMSATLLKFVLLIVLIVAGLTCPSPEPVTFLPTAADDGALMRPAFVISLFYVAFSYSGWNAAIYIAGEMKNPRRDLPLALLLGTGVVTVIYVLVNIAFMHSTPIAEMVAHKEDVVQPVARHLFGERGGAVMGMLIAIGLVSSLSAMMWAGPRVAQIMGEDWRVFRPLARRTSAGIPAQAVIFQGLIALGLFTWGGFARVRDYIQFTLELSTFLTVAGVIWLRWREPDLPRPFATWGYPLTPAIFLIFTGYVLVRVAHDKPLESSLGFATVAAGALVYFLSPRNGAAGPRRSSNASH